MLEKDHTVCVAGETMTPEQARILVSEPVFTDTLGSMD